ncbi:DUF4249 domain-containing protein [Bacteroides sp. 214]|uniref:DUF4249 domain-containing protein n=1 Tax=Bacteroides sp. 214 TaxID=2302935 RepID=UPI001EF183A0|nr:DUF4249 domain-containing protein [Bacteroides sp. 214]
MKYLFANIIALLLIVSFVSCEDIIDVNLRSVTPELVIEGVVKQGFPAEVRITKTKDFNDDNTYTPITDAIVTIADDAGNREQLTTDASGKYLATTIVGVERRTYNLTVLHEGAEYTATSTMPPAVAIDSLTQWHFLMHDYDEPMIHFADPVGEENQYYRFVFAINGNWENLEKSLLSTEFIDGNVIHNPLMLELINDPDDDDPIENGDVITVEMQCMDKATYKYFETLYMIDNSLANPTSNIKGGALGYFGAYSFRQEQIKIEW